MWADVLPNLGSATLVKLQSDRPPAPPEAGTVAAAAKDIGIVLASSIVTMNNTCAPT